MGTIITDNAIDIAIHEIVAERGEDYVYEKPNNGNCVYAVDGQPSCLVGQVIAKLSPEDFEAVVELENRVINEGEDLDTDFYTVAGVLDLGVSDRMVNALQRAQSAQDSGRPWGAALMAFERAASGDRVL